MTGGIEDARSTRLDAPVKAVFDAIGATASASAIDLEPIGRALSTLARDRDYLRGWIERLGVGSGALAIHAPARGPRLMLVHRLEGQLSAVHDHGTWVAISPIRGVETHRRWHAVRDGAAAPRIQLTDDVGLASGDVATLLPPDDVHDHGHLAGRGDPAYVLILLGDDQTRFSRNEWDAATGRHRVLPPGDGGRWLASDPMPEDA